MKTRFETSFQTYEDPAIAARKSKRKGPKTVWVSHPVSGDVEGNQILITGICREIHDQDILPVHPSFTTRRYLTPEPEDRELAKMQAETYFARGFIDEIWLFSNRITEGMQREIDLARKYGVRVVAKTSETKRALKKLNRKQ